MRPTADPILHLPAQKDLHPSLIARLPVTPKSPAWRFLLLLIAACMAHASVAQDHRTDTLSSVTRGDAVVIATQNNLEVRNARLRAEKSRDLKGSHLDLKPAEIHYYRGQIHSPMAQGLLTVSQTLGSPLKSWYKGKETRHRIRLKETGAAITRKKVARDTKIAYNQWIFLLNKRNILKQKLESYRESRRIARMKQQQGAITLIEKTRADNTFHQAQNAMHRIYKEIARAENHLRNLMNTTHSLIPASDSLEVYRIQHPSDLREGEMVDPLLQKRYREQVKIREMAWKAQQADLLPDLSAGYFTQNMGGEKHLHGWSLGLSVPLWFKPRQNAIRKARIEKQLAENNLKKQIREQQTHIQNLLREVNYLREQLRYYHNQALQQAALLIEKSRKRYKNEDVEYRQYMQGLQTAYDIRLSYIQTLKDYNQAAMQLEFYINPPEL